MADHDANGDSGRGGESLTVEELAALNDEITALVRAGLPLDVGLLGARRDLRGRLGRVVESLATRLGQGASLQDALAAEGAAIPPVYRAMLESGIRSGRPSVALEGLAEVVRGYVELRRAVGLALIYPAILVLLAYVLLIGFLIGIAPRFVATFEALRVPGVGVLREMSDFGSTAIYWAPLLPIVLLVLGSIWSRSGRSATFGSPGWQSALGWFPGIRGIVFQARASHFADLLALLLEGGVNLPDAIELAAESTGDACLRGDAEGLASRLRQGVSPAEALRGPSASRAGRWSRSFPPLLRWLIAVGSRRGPLAPALRHAAHGYRVQATQRAEFLRVVVPAVLVVVVGLSVVLIYALALFVPFTRLLQGIAETPAL